MVLDLGSFNVYVYSLNCVGNRLNSLYCLRGNLLKGQKELSLWIYIRQSHGNVMICLFDI